MAINPRADLRTVVTALDETVNILDGCSVKADDGTAWLLRDVVFNQLYLLREWAKQRASEYPEPVGYDGDTQELK